MSDLGLDKLCSKIWLLCPKAVLVKTMYYARETAYYARIMLEEPQAIFFYGTRD